MPEHHTDERLSRRSFLKAAAATAAAATVVGAGAAVLVENQAQPATYGPRFPTVTPGRPVQPATAPTPELQAQLTAYQADNARLQAELEAARQRLSELDQALSSSQEAHSALQQEWQAAQARASRLEGLLRLYEQLDGVNLGTVIVGGLGAVGAALGALLAETPSISAGAARAALALDGLESDVVWIEAGRRWLVSHLAVMSRLFAVVEVVLRTALDKSEPFLVMLGDWFADVLKWLPFGMGDKAAAVVEALTALLQETPNSISGANTYVIAPLEKWLGPVDAVEMPLLAGVIRPIRAQVIAPIESTVLKAQALHTAYAAGLDEPVRQALETESALRQAIADYRAAHQV